MVCQCLVCAVAMCQCESYLCHGVSVNVTASAAVSVLVWKLPAPWCECQCEDYLYHSLSVSVGYLFTMFACKRYLFHAIIPATLVFFLHLLKSVTVHIHLHLVTTLEVNVIWVHHICTTTCQCIIIKNQNSCLPWKRTGCRVVPCSKCNRVYCIYVSGHDP